MKKEENSLIQIGVQGHQKGIQKVNSYTWGALVYVFIHNRTVVVARMYKGSPCVCRVSNVDDFGK